MVALQQVQCLEQVVRTRSFRAAAQALDISQPAVSGHIARLERELKLALLERTPSGSVLTPDGQRIMPYLRAFATSSEDIARTSEQIQGNRTVAAAATSQQCLAVVGETRRLRGMIPHAMDALSRTYEHLTIRIESIDDDHLVAAALRSGRADLGVFSLEHGAAGRDDDIEVTPFFDLGPTGVCLRHGHPALAGPPGPIEARSLLGERLIVLDELRSREMAETVFPAATRAAVSYVDDINVGVSLVQSGVGNMVISGITAYLANGTTPWRSILGAPAYSVCLARHAERPPTPLAQQFVRYLVHVAAGCADAFRYDPATGRVHATAELDRWVETRGDDFSLAEAPRRSGSAAFSPTSTPLEPAEP